jgi:alkylation response protein AidB-like acyl-CoA dehydrogenase
MPRSAWQRLVPRFEVTDADRILDHIDGYLAEPGTAAELAALDAAGRYPAPVLAELRRRGLAELFVPEKATAPHLSAVNVATARRGGSLAITVGVTGLALLPVYLAGSAAQRAEVAARLRAGGAAAMLLTELDHGSNLLRNAAAADPDGAEFVLSGEKHLINGGSAHELLVALLRTRPSTPDALDRTRDFTVFLVERDATVRPLARWRTLPAPAADISGVRFEGTRVPASAVVGTVGGGFALVQRTLMLSHGGIAALASGAASGARELAEAYARSRNIYGEPIVRLDAIAGHLVRMAALDAVVAALAVKAAHAVNRYGAGAAALTAAAKYACCRLAEEAVDEGRAILGARALLDDVRYSAFVRDVLLYPVFDGTSHLMLDQLSGYLARQAGRPLLATLAGTREMYATAPVPIADRRRGRYGAPVAARCADLAAATSSPLAGYLATLARALCAVTRTAQEAGRWQADQCWRFDAAAVLAELEGLLAAGELASDASRAALGIPGLVGAADEAALGYAVSWLGGRLAHRLTELADRVGPAVRGQLGDLTPPEGRDAAWDALRKQAVSGSPVSGPP